MAKCVWFTWAGFIFKPGLFILKRKDYSYGNFANLLGNLNYKTISHKTISSVCLHDDVFIMIDYRVKKIDHSHKKCYMDIFELDEMLKYNNCCLLFVGESPENYFDYKLKLELDPHNNGNYCRYLFERKI